VKSYGLVKETVCDILKYKTDAYMPSEY